MKVAPYEVVIAPIVTEESQIQTVKANHYTFKVKPGANKQQIRDAIEAIWPNVQVKRVNTMNYDGKTKRHMGSNRTGRRPDWKKAIITLREGDKIELI